MRWIPLVFHWGIGHTDVMNFPNVIRRVVIVGIILGGGLLIRHWYVRITDDLLAKTTLKNARVIYSALCTYSEMHDGNFPTAEHTSNEAFRELFKAGLVEDEVFFFVKGSAWHGEATAPDRKIGDAANGFAEAVGPGENHYAYTSGLNAATSHPALPLIMDGFTDVIGTWCDDPTTRGGIRRGRFHIIVHVGGHAKIYDDMKQSQAILDLVKTVPGAKLLNPDPPK